MNLISSQWCSIIIGSLNLQSIYYYIRLKCFCCLNTQTMPYSTIITKMPGIDKIYEYVCFHDVYKTVRILCGLIYSKNKFNYVKTSAETLK